MKENKKYNILRETKRLVSSIVKGKRSGKDLITRDSDIFLVSYPKSGNTWMRFLIGNLIIKEGVDFININNYIPGIYKARERDLEKLEDPRILKSHEPFTCNYKKVIYLYRDPRDVVISYYFWKKKYTPNFNLSMVDYIDLFLDGENSQFGAWDEHVRNWLGSKTFKDGNVLIIKYEGLKKDAFKEMKKVCNFLNLKVSNQDVKKAIENSDFKNMQKLEEIQGAKSRFLKKSDPNIKFIRKGLSQWRNYLTKEQIQRFKNQYGEILIELGYEKDMNWE